MTIAVKGTKLADGQFHARVYVVGGPPDGDGDVLPDVRDGHPVAVSLGEHDVLFGADPAGEAKLRRVGNAIHAFGRTYDSVRGRELRTKLLAAGPQLEWSIGWPTDTARTRPPTAIELEQWPDAKRIIESWNPVEVSPVNRGSCGPTCRTLGAKCAAGCGYGARPTKRCDCELCVKSQARPTRPCGCELCGRRTLSTEEVKRLLEAVPQVLARARAEFGVGRPRPDDATHAFAMKILAFSYACWQQLPGPRPRIHWFHSDGKKFGRFDPITNEIHLSLELADNLDELIVTVGHEAWHAFEAKRGWPPSEAAAERCGELVLERWRQHIQRS